jgi:hypothetical protein
MALSKSEAGKLGNLASKAANAKRKEEAIVAYDQHPNRCVHCSEAISYAKRNLNQYCSRKCAHAVNSEIRSATIAANNVFTCITCSKVKAYKSNTHGKYCSNVCQHEFQKREKYKLVEDGKGSHRHVKQYLIEKHGNVCLDPLCAWDFKKSPINVELEHQDGNHENNTLANCTLLCPNCHSLTDTYKNKNMGNGRAYRRTRYAEGKSY